MLIKKILGNAYIVSILGVAAILLALKNLQFIFGGSPPLLLFLVVIAFAAWRAGLMAGLFTTILSAMSSVYFLEKPYYSVNITDPGEIVRIALLISVGSICSFIIAHLYRQEKRALHMSMDREEQLKQEIAERTRTLAERDLYLSFAKSSTEFISMCDTNGMPFFINEAGLCLVGLDDLDQGLNTHIKEFFFQEDQAFITDEFFPGVFRNGRGELEIRFRHFKTGEALWMIYNVFVLKDLNGKKIGLGTVSTNITERRRTEEALRVSQRDLSQAQAVAHIGSWRMDIRNNILEWSDESFRIFGVPKGMPLNYESFLAMVHPDDRKLVDSAWKTALTGKHYDMEHRIIVGETIKWVREQAELEFDEQGTLLGGFGTAEDITDIKSSQEALQQERAFLRQVLDATPNLIFVKDREGRFVLCNKALAKCYGAGCDSLIGLTDENFNPNADEVARFRHDDLEVINTEKTKLIPEEKVTHADGSVHWYSTVKIPLFNGESRCNKLLGVAIDITERKYAEESLRLADRRKDEFLAMLAHELRNPLAPILNAVQWLKMQESTDSKMLWSCNIIDRQVTHMSRLLDDLLEMSRIMQGKIRLEITRFELADIVNNAVETSRALIDSRGQTLIITQLATPQSIDCDPVRLAQVLSNLLDNASKYTGEGGKIALSVTREGSDAVIEVSDTGVGISPDIMPHIFDLFTQADQSLAHSQGGLGIGLTLVQRLVEMHGGTVTVSSAGAGQGSSFTVRLPVLPMDGSSAPDVAPAPSELPLPIPQFRILVVDDNADAVFSLMMLLQMGGYEVETADCGMAAIERAQSFQPRVVLLDIGLPDLNGYEVAKRLRALPETRDVILIAITGYGQPEDVKLSQSAGFNYHFLKPLKYKELSSLLASL